MAAIPTRISTITLTVVLLVLVSTGSCVASLRWRIVLVPLPLLFNIDQQIFAEFFGVLDLLGIRTRYMQIHGLVALLSRAMFHETGSTTFYLHTATSLLLNVLHVSTSVAYNLSPQIEPWKRLKVNRNAFFGPLTATKFIPFNLVRFPATESSLIN